MQDIQPIAFITRTLGPRRQTLSVYEKQPVAIVFIV